MRFWNLANCWGALIHCGALSLGCGLRNNAELLSLYGDKNQAPIVFQKLRNQFQAARNKASELIHCWRGELNKLPWNQPKSWDWWHLVREGCPALTVQFPEMESRSVPLWVSGYSQNSIGWVLNQWGRCAPSTLQALTLFSKASDSFRCLVHDFRSTVPIIKAMQNH